MRFRGKRNNDGDKDHCIENPNLLHEITWEYDDFNPYVFFGVCAGRSRSLHTAGNVEYVKGRKISCSWCVKSYVGDKART